jgi:hypothetical protein
MMARDDDIIRWKWSQLIEALRLLAAPFPVHVRVLPRWVVVPDEVALTFDDAYAVADLTNVPQEAVALLKAIDSDLSRMSEDSSGDSWTLEGLERASSWASLRAKAMAALTALGTAYSDPSIDPDTYVQSRLRR